MRILIIHNQYQKWGGEDAVFTNEAQLLTGYGHKVKRVRIVNDKIVGGWNKLKAAWQAPYAKSGRDLVSRHIREFSPHVVHVHNFFPLLTPSVYDACGDTRVPVVQTLHNYRVACAGALLMRDGRPCEDCVGSSPYKAVLHKCYRNSRLGSFAVARMIAYHHKRNTWRGKVGRFIALSEFAKSRFVAAGLPAERICVKQNFVADPLVAGARCAANRKGALFVGRLGEEKGISTMLESWERINVSLVIAGDGPLATKVRRKAETVASVQWIGQVPRKQVLRAMRSAEFLVMPSECYENFPITIAEAFACGLPVIASRLGAMAEIVEDNVTGLLFTPRDPGELAAKVKWAAENAGEMRKMGRQARRVYEKTCAPSISYDRLMTVYQQAIEDQRGTKC